MAATDVQKSVASAMETVLKEVDAIFPEEKNKRLLHAVACLHFSVTLSNVTCTIPLIGWRSVL